MAIQITIRDVPEKVRDELAARAALQGKSMQEYLRTELERMAARPSVDAWLEQSAEEKARVANAHLGRRDSESTRRWPTLSVVVDACTSGCGASRLRSGWRVGGEHHCGRLPVRSGSSHSSRPRTLCARFERAKRITAAEANAAHEDLMELNIEIYSPSNRLRSASGSCATTLRAMTLGMSHSRKRCTCPW